MHRSNRQAFAEPHLNHVDNGFTLSYNLIYKDLPLTTSACETPEASKEEKWGTMRTDEYAHRQRPNGRVIHWFPTLGQTRKVIDRLVRELFRLRIGQVFKTNRMQHWSEFASTGLVDEVVSPEPSKAQILPTTRIFTELTEPEQNLDQIATSGDDLRGF